MKQLAFLSLCLQLVLSSCCAPQTASVLQVAPDDTTPPAITGGLTVVPGASTLKVSWSRATDDVTGQVHLQYRVVKADAEASMSSVDRVLALAPAKDWTSDLTAYEFTGLTSQKTYWVDVVVTDGIGNRSRFEAVSATTLASDPVPTTTNAYYASLKGLSGKAFRTGLHALLNTGVVRFSYPGVWGALEYTDEDPANPNNVIEIYTGWSIPKTYKAQNNEADGWNREHVWAKSHGNFGTDTGPGTDLHHLRPADSTVNSTRNNNDFDNGGTPVTDNSPYGTYPGVTGDKINGSLSWEVRDQDKGDVARMIFYMAVMYDGLAPSGYDPVDLEPSEGVGNESAPTMGRLSTLKAWNRSDPVDAWEIRRNDRIFEKQGNRNPFIDNPGWVDVLW